jgi:hypothetical protein
MEYRLTGCSVLVIGWLKTSRAWLCRCKISSRCSEAVSSASDYTSLPLSASPHIGEGVVDEFGERTEQETSIWAKWRPLAVDLDRGAAIGKEVAGGAAEDVEVGGEGAVGEG